MRVSGGAFIREATAELFRDDVFEYFIDATLRRAPAAARALRRRERGHM